jgi:hypothetical protein
VCRFSSSVFSWILRLRCSRSEIWTGWSSTTICNDCRGWPLHRTGSSVGRDRRGKASAPSPVHRRLIGAIARDAERETAGGRWVTGRVVLAVGLTSAGLSVRARLRRRERRPGAAIDSKPIGRLRIVGVRIHAAGEAGLSGGGFLAASRESSRMSQARCFRSAVRRLRWCSKGTVRTPPRLRSYPSDT